MGLDEGGVEGSCKGEEGRRQLTGFLPMLSTQAFQIQPHTFRDPEYGQGALLAIGDGKPRPSRSYASALKGSQRVS